MVETLLELKVLISQEIRLVLQTIYYKENER